MSGHACDADFFLATTGIATCRVCGSQWQYVNVQKTETKQ